MSFLWTDKADAMLRDLYAKGHPFSVIAYEMTRSFNYGELTRNACIGRAHRIGLKGRSDEVRRAQREEDIRRVEERKQEAMAKRPGIGFMEMRDGLCRFPISKETSFDKFRACGCPCSLTKPYCEGHMQIASRPSEPPRIRESRPEPRAKARTFDEFVSGEAA